MNRSYEKSTIFSNLLKLKHQVRGLSFNLVSNNDKVFYVYPLIKYINQSLESFMLSWTSVDARKLKYSEDFKGYIYLTSVTLRDMFSHKVIHAKDPNLVEGIQRDLTEIIAKLEIESDNWYNKYHSKES
jgi:hypothetical protein